MPYLIDAHQDMAWNWLNFGTDYTLPLKDIRLIEAGEIDRRRGGSSLCGWPEFVDGQVALIFGTFYIGPKKYADGEWDSVVFTNNNEYSRLVRKSADYYKMLEEKYPTKFQRVLTKRDLSRVLEPWQSENNGANSTSSRPIGLVNLIEGAEGLSSFQELEEWWQFGVRILGPVWAGTRFCGGSYEGTGFTSEGHHLLSILSEIGYTLDVAHMNDQSIQTVIAEYDGNIIATHANCRWLLKNPTNQRHLSKENVQGLIEREAVIGVLPYAKFLRTDWDISHPVSLEDLADHIDAICQIAGNARHAAIGTDFGCGFGWPSVPEEVNSIADMQKLARVLQNRGYTTEEIDAIYHQNWERILSRSLPES